MSDPLSLGGALVAEIDRLDEVSAMGLLVWVAAIAFATALARSALTAGVRLAWRIGLDRQRALGRFAAVIQAIVWALGLVLALRPLFANVPVLTTLAVGAASLSIAIALPGLVQSVAAGLTIAVRARFREGDQIEVRGQRGSIRTLGVVRTQLRVEDGSVVWLPNSILDSDAVKVERSSGAAPVRVRFEVSPGQRARVLDEVRTAATLSPFRRAGSRPRLTSTSDDDTRYVVELQTWATRELETVRRSLGVAVREIVDRVEPVDQEVGQ